MTGSFILFVVLIASPTGTPRPVVIQQEFLSQTKCVAALESIRKSASNVRIDLATCEQK
jgi:hypothetical protein